MATFMESAKDYVIGTDFDNAKIKIKDGQTAEDILKDITDTETLQQITDAILIDKNFLTLEEYNKLAKKDGKNDELARKDKKKIQQLYRLGHLSKAKSLHTECDMDDLVKAMDAFNLGKDKTSGGGSSGDDETKPEPEESEPEEPEPEESKPEEPELKSETSDDVEKTFKEIGSKSAEITKLLSTQSAIGDFKNELSRHMEGLKGLTDNIKGKSMECLQSLAMSLFGVELDSVASATVKMILGASIISIPSYPNEVGDIIFTVFKYSTLSVKYFIKLYITYIIGALAKSGLESGSEDFKKFMNDAKHKLLQIATAASVDIAEVQHILAEYIPTVITSEIKKQQMTDFMEAVQTGLQESKEDRIKKIRNVEFQTQKLASFGKIPDHEKENTTDVPTTVGELSESRLVQMIETEDLDEDIKKGLEEKLEKITGKRGRNEEEPNEESNEEPEGPPSKRPKPNKEISGGKKQHTRKQKKQSKKQKKNSKNKSKKQKKNRTKKIRGKKH